MIIGLTILAIFIVFILVVLLYHSNAYPEVQEIADKMKREGRDYWFYGDTGVGFIIFTGAKVKETGYSYIAGLLHEQGHTVVIPKQIFTMSAFGTNHAIEIMKKHTEVNKWILIGHSLGGVPVTRVAGQAPEYLTGIVYLASCASSDLSGLDFPALRITAENDKVMNNERMNQFAGNLPAGSETILLEGGIHRGFGSYNSRFSREEETTLNWKQQNEQSVQLILDFYAERIAEAENK